MTTLAGEHLTVHYHRDAAAALDDVSCHVSGGEFVVVAGPNGSGKSTCLRALLGLLPLSHGEVRLDDQPLSAWPRDRLARHVAALPQREEPAFSLSVRDAVGLGRWARLGAFGRPSRADHDAVADALALTSLTSFADRSIESLSGGEWQRVRLARALAAQPQLLLLDEPGTALDLAHEMAFYELLATLVRQGLGVLAITHHLNAALRYADRVILFDRGRIAADGPPGQALTAERVSRVFHWPVALDTLADGSPHLIPLRRAPDAARVPGGFPTEDSPS